MTIDVHAHYVPQSLVAAARQRGADMGVRVIDGAATPALEFSYGFKVRPFFPKLVETAAQRTAWLDTERIDRQLVATWPDIYAYGLPPEQCVAWHALLIDTLAGWCYDNAGRFAFVASVPLPNAEDAAAELARAAKFGLTQSVQYTFDTTLGVGSLIFSGVLDRFPSLTLVLSHGGGAYPYLAGRFDIMHARMDKSSQGDVAQRAPSSYAQQMVYDSIVHAPKPLRFLADLVGIDRLVLGTDYSFPPADLSPLASLRAAGFDAADIKKIAEDNPYRLFPRLNQRR